jgi:hypothetical protein
MQPEWVVHVISGPKRAPILAAERVPLILSHILSSLVRSSFDLNHVIRPNRIPMEFNS